MNGSTGAVVTYVGITGNIPYRYGAGVGITANSYFTVQSGSIGDPTDKLILSGATSAIAPQRWGNTEAIGLEFHRGYQGDGIDDGGGVAIVAKGVYDDGGGYLYGGTLRLTTSSSDEGGTIILAPQQTGVVYVNSGEVAVYTPLWVNSNITTTGNFSGTTGAFSKLLTASAGISAAGGVTFFGTFSGTTGAFSKLLTLSGGLSASGATFSGTISAAQFSGSLASCTGLPVSTGIAGLCSGIATFLATPTSANLKTALTDETGSGKVVFSGDPIFTEAINIVDQQGTVGAYLNLSSIDQYDLDGLYYGSRIIANGLYQTAFAIDSLDLAQRYMQIDGAGIITLGDVGGQYFGAVLTIDALSTPPLFRFGAPGITGADVKIYGLLSNGLTAGTIGSAGTIAPTNTVTFISGTSAISIITPPLGIDTSGGQITLIPTAAFTTVTGGGTGGIALASTAVVSKALIMTYDAGTGKWYPSY